MASQDLAALRVRLAQLAALKGEGVLTDEEDEAKRTALVDEFTAARNDPSGDLDGNGRHVNWLGITLASMFVPFYLLVYGIYAWFTRFSAKRKWQSGLIFAVYAVVWPMVVIGLIGGALSGGPSSSPASASAPAAQTLSIGDTWRAAQDGWDITVDGAATTPAFQGGVIGLPHVAHGLYLAVTVTMMNTGDSAHALGANRFKLVNGAGQRYDAAGFNRAYANGSYGEDVSFGQDVNPGETLQGILFFDVPRNSSGLQLHVIGGGVFTLGDGQGGQFAAPAGPASHAQGTGGCDTANSACCPYVLSTPAAASTAAIVRCAHWAPDANAVNWWEIRRVLCARKQTEQIAPELARDPVLSTVPCPAGN